MKATMETKNLKEALQKVNLIKPNRILPVLTYARAELSDGKMVLTTTDMERAIRVEVKCNNSENYTLLLPRKTLDKFLYTGKNLKEADGKVEISQGSLLKQINVKRGKLGDANMYVVPEKEFPPLPFADNLDWHTLDGKWFCRMLKIVSVACATEPSRPILEGIAIRDGAMAAADGFRLALLKDTRLSFGLGDKQTVVNRETIALIIRLFSKEDKLDVAFGLAKESQFSTTDPKEIVRRIHLKSSNTTLTAECTQGTYPNYEQLIPKSFSCKLSFSVPLMLQRLNMIDATSIPSGITRLKFYQASPSGEYLCFIQARLDDDGGEYSLECPVKLEAGEDSKIALQHRYLIDALKPFSLCEFEISSPSSPVKLTGDIEGLTMVVMPMFVQW